MDKMARTRFRLVGVSVYMLTRYTSKGPDRWTSCPRTQQIVNLPIPGLAASLDEPKFVTQINETTLANYAIRLSV